MKNLGLDAYGITNTTQIIRNPSYEELYKYEMDPANDGYERAVETALGAVAVDTGRFTGRSPQDKYFVVEETSKDHIWWAGPDHPGSGNKPMSEAVWDELHKLSAAELSNRRLFVFDGFAGANEDTRIAVRVITEVAWQCHFCTNMFIRPTEEELANFKPDWVILNACETTCTNYEELGLRSEVFAANNIKARMSCIGGTWYGGEMKKGIFTIMNYFLPLRGIGAFHCSANQGEAGDTALFFGLSGTGKTTLSTDPGRALIGDDEHGWDDEGIFNFEGGCYAKVINLSPENEPDIYKAIRRNALLENVVVKANGDVDFNDGSKTENTRVTYPIDHIDNIVRPVSRGGHPKHIIFLTCDAFGVLPPVSKLNPEQAMYQYLSGYTAKVAGTELGVKEPKATFSTCFGAPFLAVHPTMYADVLGTKMGRHGSHAWLINTGWTGGAYGVGQRMSLPVTRKLIDAIFSGELEAAEYETFPIFGFDIPKAVAGIDPKILNPRESWADQAAFDAQLATLGQMFADNFKLFTDSDSGKQLASAGPRLAEAAAK